MIQNNKMEKMLLIKNKIKMINHNNNMRKKIKNKNLSIKKGLIIANQAQKKYEWNFPANY